MPFPEVKRVIYEHNPLDKVICQLRFPPILRIECRCSSCLTAPRSRSVTVNFAHKPCPGSFCRTGFLATN